MAKLTDEEFGAKLVAAYRAYKELHESGALGADAESPRDTVNNWISTIRDCKAQDEGGLGPVHIMKRGAQDNPPPTPGTPQPHVAGQDSALEGAEDDLIRASGVNVDNRLWEARARRTSGTRVARVAAAIPGYDRLK